MGKLVKTAVSETEYLKQISGGYALRLFPIELRTQFKTKKGNFFITTFVDDFDSARMNAVAKASDGALLVKACGEENAQKVMRIFGKNGRLELKRLDDINTVLGLVEAEIGGL